jgi:Cu/Zn superoxide dismutase
MKTRVLGLAIGALGLTIAVTAATAGTTSHATVLRLTTALNSAQEVPAPTGNVSGARGTFTGTLTKTSSGANLSWRLAFSGLTGRATAAHIHTGARGQPGPVSVPLCGPCDSGASGDATVTPTVLQAIQSGGAYTNVHTAANGPGEIRGQLSVLARVRGALNAAQEVPRPRGVLRGARGTFTGTLTKTGSTGRLAWRLTFARLTGRAVAAHIHIARRGRPGPVALPLCGPCRNGARGTATANAALLNALEAGRAYVNVHTSRNAPGEIRAQLPAVQLVMSTS